MMIKEKVKICARIMKVRTFSQSSSSLTRLKSEVSKTKLKFIRDVELVDYIVYCVC